MDLLYANDGLLASPQPACLQAALDVLAVTFDRLGLCTNMKKMVGMVSHPCKMAGGHPEVAYEQQMMGVGNLYRARQQERVRRTK